MNEIPEDEFEKLQNELFEAKLEIRYLQNKLLDKDKELEQLKESKDKMRDHLMEGNIRIYDRESEKLYIIDEQGKEIQGLKNDISRYKKEISELQERISELKKQIEEKNNEPKWERLENVGEKKNR